MFVTSLANDTNDETPWQKTWMMESNLSCGVTTLLCCFDQCCWGCLQSAT